MDVCVTIKDLSKQLHVDPEVLREYARRADDPLPLLPLWRVVIRGGRGGPLKPPPPAESCSCPTSTAFPASPSAAFGVPCGHRCPVRSSAAFHTALSSMRRHPRLRGADRLLTQPGLCHLI